MEAEGSRKCGRVENAQKDIYTAVSRLLFLLAHHVLLLSARLLLYMALGSLSMHLCTLRPPHVLSPGFYTLQPGVAAFQPQLFSPLALTLNRYLFNTILSPTRVQDRPRSTLLSCLPPSLLQSLGPPKNSRPTAWRTLPQSHSVMTT
jgi:hypothetical protein